jgi:hypothetical protein
MKLMMVVKNGVGSIPIKNPQNPKNEIHSKD